MRFRVTAISRLATFCALTAVAAGGFGAILARGAPPAGFQETTAFSGLSNPSVVRFSPDGRIFVGEKSGVIKVFDNLSDASPTVFADLRTNVQNFWDRGLLGLALPPNFPTVPYVYVLYTFDGPIGGTAPTWGDGCPNPPGATGDGCVVAGRLSRLQAEGDVMTGPEQILIEDWCQQYPSHSTGTLAFGPDGALYVSGGEGASFNFVDYGQDGSPLNPCGDPPAGLGGAQTPPTAEGGALRSQDLRTSGDPVGLSGSILRLDPSTGAGFSTNALAGHPDPNARRIVAHGLRNPFRFTLRPGTNEVWLGDVGWNRWEEINRIPDPTAAPRNFGWPCYEGAGRRADYEATGLAICTGLYAEAGAVTGPYFTYAHNTPIAGEICPTGGSSISGLAFYQGGSYPSAYSGALFFADYSRDCIWVMRAGANGLPDPATITPFVTGASGPVDLQIGPGGDLFYADLNGGTIKRIQFVGGNQPPVAVATASPTSGAVPLTVQFDGTGSSDPDGDVITYAWDLDGDGAYDDSTAAAPTTTYSTAGSYSARLRVTDARDASSDSTPIVISAGAGPNTPPTARIDAPASELTWRAGDAIAFSGSGTDPEDGQLPSLAFSWSLALHHCSTDAGCHVHPLQTWTGVSWGSFSAPDHEYPSHLELTLTVTDSVGATNTASVRLDPLTTELGVQSVPTGLQLSVGNMTATAPFSRTVIVGSRNSLAALSPQALAGTAYEFSFWSDGGPRAHDVVVNAPSTYTATFAAASGPLAFAPTDDSYVEADLPGTNFGTSTQTVADASPQRDAMLRFAVSGLTGRTVSSARLRLYCVNGSPFGGAIRRVADNSWRESTVTWSNAPAGDATPLASLGAVAAGTWYEVDVTQAVAGDGVVSFRITSPNADGAYYSTKEGAAGFAPQLVVQPAGPPDTTPPTAPTALTATAVSATRIDLGWDPSTDNGTIAGYRIRRGGVEVATVTGTSYSDTTVQPSTTYTYDVIAVDAAGNVSTPSAPASATTPPAATTLTFAATDDTYVASDRPTRTYGAAGYVTADNQPPRHVLLRFAVAGTAGRAVRSVKLRVYCVHSAPIGGAFHRVADTTWREGAVTWDTAPAADVGTLATLGSVGVARWYEVDVTQAVTGDGAVAFKIDSTSRNGADYRSKEGNPAQAPQLVVTLQ